MKKKLISYLALVFIICLGVFSVVSCNNTEAEHDDNGDVGDGGNQGSVDTYTVTFETVGGSLINSIEVEKGKTVTRPEDPVKDGADFIDWYLSSTYEGNPYDFNSPVNSDLTLYARWSDEEYAVVFDTNGGYPLIEYATYKYGTKLEEPSEPEKVGYKFTGWYSDVKCSNKVNFPYEVKGHTRLYAGWKSDTMVTVNFKMARKYQDDRDINYDAEILEPITIKAGEKLIQPENPRDITYLDEAGEEHLLRFSYWNSDPYYGYYSDAILFPIETADVKEITLYAVYVEVDTDDTYASLTVHPNNGEEETIMYGVLGESLEISNLNEHDPAPFYSNKEMPLKVGYEVSGYYKTSDFASDSIYEVPFVLENEENDVYIRWQKKDDVTVTFDYGFSSIEDKTMMVSYRGLIERPENMMIVGYTFDGWYTTLNSAVEEYRWNFENDIVESDITLYAKWVKTATIITYDTCGGYERNPIAVSKDRVIQVLPTPVRQSGDIVYNFLGWYLDSSYNEKVSLPLTVSSDITLYAKWSDAIDLSLFEILDLGSNNNYGYSISVKKNKKSELVGTITLPSLYAGKNIVRIETAGFADCINIKEIIVPDTVKYIYRNAFKNCSSLEKVVLPDTLKQISLNVFSGCSKLASINYPSELYSLYANVFENLPLMLEQLEVDEYGLYYWGNACLGKTYVTSDRATDNTTSEIIVKDGTTLIASYAFYNMEALTTITFADSVKYMPNYVFPQESKSVLKNVNLSASYTSAGNLTTIFPYNLESITIPENNKEFKVIDGNLISLEDMRLVISTINSTSIPEGVVIIGESSFTNKDLDTVIIPNTVTTIHQNAFADSKFISINLPDSVGVLDSTAFSGCSSLESITFGANINLENTLIFEDMRALKTLSVSPNNPYLFSQSDVLYSKLNYSILFFAPKHEGSIEIAEGTKIIPSNIFKSNGIYESFIIPDSVETIENNALNNLSISYLYLGKNVKELSVDFGSFILVDEVEVSKENPYMTSLNGCLYNKDITRLLLIPASFKSYEFPDTVSSVDPYIYMPYIADLTLGASISKEMFEYLIWGSEEYGYNISYCSPLSVKVSPNNKELVEFNGVIYTKDKQNLVYIPAGFNGDLILPKEMGKLDEIVITKTVKDYVVGDELIDNQINIKNLKVEEGSKLKEIGKYAFTNFNYISADLPGYIDNDFTYRVKINVNNVDLSNALNLELINESAFYSLEELYTVKLPNKEYEIGINVFTNCINLESVTGLGDAIVNNSFYGANKLYDEEGLFISDNSLISASLVYTNPDFDGNLIIPAKVKKINSGAISYLNLRSIKIPETVEIIKTGAISPISDINIEVVSKDTILEDNWYISSDEFDIIVIVAGETTSDIYYYTDPTTGLYYRLFNGQAKLVSDSKATSAWVGAVSLGNITYDDKTYILTELADDSLSSKSSNITSLTIPNTVTKIGDSVFNDISADELIIPDSVLEIGNQLFSYNEVIKKVYISKNITTIPRYMFDHCSNLEEVITDNIKVIEEFAFANTLKLIKFNFNNVSTIGNQAFINSGINEATFNSLETVGEKAFSNSKLNILVLNEGLKSVGSQAFSNTLIKELILPSTLVEYGDYAFYANNNLEKLVVKGSILGNGVFQQSKVLKEVDFIGENNYEVGQQTFWQDTALEKLTFSEGLIKIGNTAFRETRISEIIFPNTLEEIGDQAFYYASLSEITIPSSVKSIGDYAFYDNYKLDLDGEKIRTLEKINFNEGLVSIGQRAFGYAVVEELYLPPTLVEYGDYAFYLCENLKMVVFADGSTVIGGKGAFQVKALEKVIFGQSDGLIIEAQTFYGASALTEIVFADNCIIKELKDYCFGNTNLKELTLSEVEVMGRQVFYHCTGLTLTIPYGEDNIPDSWNANWNTSDDCKVIYS